MDSMLQGVIAGMRVSWQSPGIPVLVCVITLASCAPAGHAGGLGRKADSPALRYSQAAHPLRVSLSKDADGFIRITVRNLGTDDVALERYSERYGRIEVLSLNGSGTWVKPAPVNPGAIVDYERATPSDWVLLGAGDELSWDLGFNEYATLKAGERVRLTWLPSERAQPKWLGKARSFPASRQEWDLTIE